MADIENLSIVISASADDAIRKINALSASIGGLGKATSHVDAKPVADSMVKVASTTETAEKSTTSFRDRLKSLADHMRNAGSSAKSGTAGISGFVASLKRIAYYRFIRSILKEITQAFRDGIKNLYAWSSAVNGQFASSMNSISTATNYLKNSLGAMAAPLINSLAPAINYVIDLFVSLINVVNQFFAALGGQSTYTAAKKVATEWGGAAKSVGSAAKGAAKEIRTLLGFDEINKLEDSSGGGGGGGGGGGSSGGVGALFEERPINSTIKNIADGIREIFGPIFTWLGDNLDIVSKVVAGIGAALLAWKIGTKLFPGLESFSGTLAEIALALAGLTAGVVLTITSIELAKKEGLTWKVAGAGILGALGFATAGYAIAKLLGLSAGAGGVAAFGLSLAVTATIISAELLKQEGLTWKVAGVGLFAALSGGVGGMGIAKMVAAACPKLGIKMLEGFGAGFGLTLGVVGTIAFAELLKNDGLTWKSAGAGIISALGFGAAGASIASILMKVAPGLGITKLTGFGIGFGVSLAVLGTIGTAELVAKDGLTWKSAATSFFGALGGGAAGASIASILSKLIPSLGISKLTGGKIGFSTMLAVEGTITYAELVKKDGLTWQAAGSGLVAAASAAYAGSTLAGVLGLSKVAGGLAGFFIELGVLGSITTAQFVKQDHGFTWKAAASAGASVASFSAAGAAAAAALGFSMVGGALIGAAIGVGVIAYIVSTEYRKSLINWGTQELGAEEIENEVKKRMTFDVDAVVNVVGTSIANRKEAKDSLNLQIALFNMFLNKVKIGAEIDDSEKQEAYNNLKDNIIPGIQSLLDAGQNVVEVSFSLAPPKDSEGNALDAAGILNAMKSGNSVLMEGINDFADEINNIINGAMGRAFTVDEAQLIENYFGAIERITNALTTGKVTGEYKTKMDNAFSVALSDLSFESFKNLTNAYFAESKTLYDSLLESANAAKVAMYGELSALQQLAQEHTNQGLEIPEEVTNRMNQLNELIADYDPYATAQAEWEKSVEPFKQELLETFSTVYSDAIANAFGNDNLTGNVITTYFENDINQADAHKVQLAFDAFLQEALGGESEYKYQIDVAGKLGLTGWDIVGQEAQYNFFKALSESLGSSSQAMKYLKDLGYNTSGIIELGIKEGLLNPSAAIKPAAQNTGKNVVDNIKAGMAAGAPGIGQQADNLFNSVMNKFSNKDKGKQAGKTAVDNVSAGIKAKPVPVISVDIARKWFGSVYDYLHVSNLKTTIASTVAKAWKGTPQQALGVDNLTTTVNVGVKRGFAESVYKKLSLNGLSTTVDVGIKKGWTGSAIKAIGLSGLETDVKLKPVLSGNTKLTLKAGVAGALNIALTKAIGGIFSAGRWRNIPQYAGGTTNAGSLFIAGEAGPEIVGHVGGRTEVLNQSQLAATMFAAVRNGMTGMRIEGAYDSTREDDDANMEMLMELVRAGSEATQKQNELLRQQNDYLRQINNKNYNLEVTTNSINRAQQRMNRRTGTTVVPVGT